MRIADLLGDKGAVVRPSDRGIRRELMEHMINGEPRRRQLQSRDSAVAAPTIVFRSFDHVGPNGVQGDIAEYLQQVGFLVDEEGLESSLEEMTDPLVAPVEPLGVLGLEPLHPAGERGIRGLENQVKVVVEECIRRNNPTVTTNGLAEEIDKGESILVGTDDVLAGVAAVGGVPKGAWIFDAKRSCHNAPRLPRRQRNAEESTREGMFEAENLLGMETNRRFVYVP